MDPSNPSPEFCLAYVTCPSREEALRLGRAAVSARLAACANVVPGMTSVYEWHPYETPCFLVFGVDGGSPGFLDFLRAGVGPRDRSEAS